MRVLALVVLAGWLVVGCGDSGPPYEVSTTVVTGPSTADMTVWEPVGEGPWPVVYAVPGSNGTDGSATRDFDVFADELASHGIVVFGTDYLMGQIETRVGCGYRYMLEAAPEFGGDLSQPVTFFGYSMGAIAALRLGLAEDSYGPESNYEMPCPPGTERPGIIVSLNGCHTAYSEIESRVRLWGNQDAEITLISGDSDDACGSQHSIEAQILLAEVGYDATYVEIPDANHWQVIFHDLSYGTYKTLEPDDPAGQATVQAVVDAIGITTDTTD